MKEHILEWRDLLYGVFRVDSKNSVFSRMAYERKEIQLFTIVKWPLTIKISINEREIKQLKKERKKSYWCRRYDKSAS